MVEASIDLIIRYRKLIRISEHKSGVASFSPKSAQSSIFHSLSLPVGEPDLSLPLRNLNMPSRSKLVKLVTGTVVTGGSSIALLVSYITANIQFEPLSATDPIFRSKHL
ncbi:hypothetical protein BDV34DRAFT_198516 [Aspergillus parasiticus]|uniref:Uncharacterized protein n=1 Tax=Aspergillus parasiticus TaxID=5067 RepID=A0A5N6DI38_ASPPA|nr:hypothetical protein BDV34DRAFT_198516 [Aspergillus parasiticus]